MGSNKPMNPDIDKKQGQSGEFGGGKQAPGRNPQDDQSTGRRPNESDDLQKEDIEQMPEHGGRGGFNR